MSNHPPQVVEPIGDNVREVIAQECGVGLSRVLESYPEWPGHRMHGSRH